MIAIVDYGAGNLNSVKKAFVHLGAEVVVTNQPETVAVASKIVLPGVGHFSSLQALNRTGLREVLLQSACSGQPYWGSAWECSGFSKEVKNALRSQARGSFPANAGSFLPR